MGTELLISFDGDTESLREHRLSIAEFGNAIRELLQAVRRTATAMLSAADNEGQFARQAAAIDLELGTLSQGSVGLAFAVTATPRRQPSLLPEDNALAASAISNLLDCLERESRGEPCSRAARRYLRALPPSVRSQTYELRHAGAVRKSVKISSVALAEPELALPRVQTLVGLISRVGFAPGRPMIGIMPGGGDKMVECTASDSLVEIALQLRGREIYATTVARDKDVRLVALRASPFVPSSAEQRIEEMSLRWGNTLRRLAE